MLSDMPVEMFIWPVGINIGVILESI
jgi:hypothetical protein